MNRVGDGVLPQSSDLRCMSTPLMCLLSDKILLVTPSRDNTRRYNERSDAPRLSATTARYTQADSPLPIVQPPTGRVEVFLGIYDGEERCAQHAYDYDECEEAEVNGWAGRVGQRLGGRQQAAEDVGYLLLPSSHGTRP